MHLSRGMNVLSTIRTTTPARDFIWAAHGLPKWEQTVLQVLVLPVNLVSMLCKLVLTPLFALLGPVGVLPLFVLNVVWLASLAVFLPLSILSLAVPLLRPVCFLLAVPFLLIGYFANAISPVLKPDDAGPHLFKCDLVEVFPYSYPLMHADKFIHQMVEQMRRGSREDQSTG